MKNYIIDFLRRGFIACGFGPLILAVLYLILQRGGVIQILTVNEVSVGIFSLYALAFVAGGMNVIYQLEQIPLMVAILIHGSALYVSYLVVYLLNGWLDWGTTPILAFSVIFLLGYLGIWAVIYTVTRKSTDRVNEMLKKKQNRINVH